MQLDSRETNTILDYIVLSPTSIALDTLAGKIYWADHSMQAISYANLDGTDHGILISTGHPTDLILDQESGYLYWTDLVTDTIHRVNLDGSGLKSLNEIALTRGQGIALDVKANQVYWTDPSTQTISRANLDGTGQEVLIDNAVLDSPKDIILDVDNDRMYWSDLGRRTIESAALNGLDQQTIVPADLIAPVSLFLDTNAEKLYWLDQDCNTKPGSSCVERANPDGTARETVFVIGPYRADGITLDLTTKKLFWTSESESFIEGVNLDGSNRELVLSHPGHYPYALALDQIAGKLYWTDPSNRQISRMNLGGSDIEVLVSNLIADPHSIALDVQAGKMYWVDPKFGANKPTIERANLDGTDREALITTDLNAPGDIAIDLVAGKFYWTDYNTKRIERANLDGTGREALITDLESVSGIALDVADNRMYWSSSRLNQDGLIERADLDGSRRELFIHSDLNTPTDLAVDPHSGHLYWLQALNQIERSTLVPNQRAHIAGPLSISHSFVLSSSTPVGTSTQPVNASIKQPSLTNYPNPFRQSTTFEVELSAPGLVHLKMYDMLGRRVATLVNREMPAGKHALPWAGEKIQPGAYMARLEVAGEIRTAMVFKID